MTRLEQLTNRLPAVPRGTRQQRQVLLVGGLFALTVVNYLDLRGYLALGLGEIQLVSLVGGWLLVEPGTQVEELAVSAKRLLVGWLSGAPLFMWARFANPGAGDHYLQYTTTPGLAGTAISQVWGVAAAIMMAWMLLVRGREWVSEWRHLRQTTPEECVLEDM